MSERSAGRPAVLLLGGAGQVGTELRRALAPRGAIVAPSHAELDLADADALRRTVRGVAPQAIVNAAAYTAVDQAEREPALAHAINGDAPGVLAEEAARLDVPLVHYSTDYVFDGTAAVPYDEGAATAPLSVYGASKLAGERAVLQGGARALVLRTSWVYGAHGRNFLATMLRVAQRADDAPVRVVGDQRGAPTSSAFLADATARLLAGAEASGAWGLYHVAAAGMTTWCEFARAIFAGAARRGMRVPRVECITTAAYASPVTRPAYSVLDTSRAARTFGLVAESWQAQLERVLDARLGPALSLVPEPS